MKQLPLVASFILFIALCAALAYWGLQLFRPPLRPVAAAPAQVEAEVRLDAAAALFGGRPAAMAVASNYELKGVLMSAIAAESAAIIAADGKPANAVPVGKEVMAGVTVREVHPQYVVLSEHGVSKRIELPASARAPTTLYNVAPATSYPGLQPEPQQPAPPPPQEPTPPPEQAAQPAAGQ